MVLFNSLLILFSSIVCNGTENKFPHFVKSDQPHQVRVLNEGTTAFNQILQMIDGARTSLDLEYYIFHNDLSGRIVIKALHQKVRAGVKIRLLLEHSSSAFDLNDLYAARLVKMGIDVKYFNRSFPPFIKGICWNNHRKLIIADRSSVLLGGRNIGDEYFDRSTKYNFIDRDIYIEGPISEEIAQSFDAFWSSHLASNPSVRWYYDEKYNPTSRLIGMLTGVRAFFQKDSTLNKNRARQEEVGLPLLRDSPLFACRELIFVSDEPSNPKISHVSELIQSLIKSSSQQIIAESPYTILKDHLYQNMIQFIKRGGELELLTNGLYSSDIKLIQPAFLEHIKSPIQNGGKIYLYGGGHPPYPMVSSTAKHTIWGTHAKTMVFDLKHSLISSFNLDPRSDHLNHELALVCLNQPDLALHIANNIHLRMQAAGLLGPDGFPIDHRFPYNTNPFILKGGLLFFSPFILLLEDLM